MFYAQNISEVDREEYKTKFHEVNGFYPSGEVLTSNETIAYFLNNYDELKLQSIEDQHKELQELSERHGTTFSSWTDYYQFTKINKL